MNDQRPILGGLRVYPAKIDKMRFTDEEFRDLYERGLSDTDISKILEVASGTVRKRRLLLGLPRNFEPFSGAPEGSLSTLRKNNAEVSERRAERMKKKDPEAFREMRRRVISNLMLKVRRNRWWTEKYRSYSRENKRMVRSTLEGREKLREIQSEWRQRHPEKVQEINRRNWLELKSDPIQYKRHNIKHGEEVRRYAFRHPEKVREKSCRYWLKLKSDPIRYEKYKAGRREYRQNRVSSPEGG